MIGNNKGNDTTSTNETPLAKPKKRRSQRQRKKAASKTSENAASKTNENAARKANEKSCKLSAEGTACSFLIFMYK